MDIVFILLMNQKCGYNFEVLSISMLTTYIWWSQKTFVQVFSQKNLFFQNLSCKTQGLAYLECGLSARLYTNQRSQVWSVSIQNYYPCTIWTNQPWSTGFQITQVWPVTHTWPYCVKPNIITRHWIGWFSNRMGTSDDDRRAHAMVWILSQCDQILVFVLHMPLSSDIPNSVAKSI